VLEHGSPTRPAPGRTKRVWSDSVADLAAGHDVPVLLRERADDEGMLDALKRYLTSHPA
jgi:hypothetical protein